MEEIVLFVHHNGSVLLPDCPCDTTNESDSKMHWMAEEIHHPIGCLNFRNHRHLILVSNGGEWVDGGGFSPSLGSFPTIPKAKQGLPLGRTQYRYLDAVCMDIMFGNFLLVGGFCYALILVDRTTRYN